MAASPLLEYFDNAQTRRTVTGASWGSEIETHFLDERGRPVSIEVSRKLKSLSPPGPWSTTIDLGRQNIELITQPQDSPDELLAATEAGLDWLYHQAAQLGARPLFQPSVNWPHQNLLWVQEKRDELWRDLDGQPALEHLCRVASVQITLSVHPAELIPAINALWEARLHRYDYAANDAGWRAYVDESNAGYRSDRYAGPAGFTSLEDYVNHLRRQTVLMPSLSRGLPLVEQQDLFVRSVWPHYRARSFAGPGRRVSALEIRPFARRDDSQIATVIQRIRETLGV